MDEKKLQLTLGLPGDNAISSGVIECGKVHNSIPWGSSSSNTCSVRTSTSEFVHKGVCAMEKESSQSCYIRKADFQTAENKAISPSSVNSTLAPVSRTNTNTSHKRAAPAPVVGWPPIRSFRKNLASTSTGKTISESQDAIPNKPLNRTPANVKAHANKGQFVKINMDGVPIGRKVDLSIYNDYASLSSAVDELFRGLLAAQNDSPAAAKHNKQEDQKPIFGLLDGSGEYTLVYEDNEGDRVLVGDVPWHMFVSTVKRLRVLKSADLPTLNCGGKKEGKIQIDSSSK